MEFDEVMKVLHENSFLLEDTIVEKVKGGANVLNRAAGTVLLGTVFAKDKWSPYEEINPKCKVMDNATVEDIDNIFWNLCKKDNYNEVLNWQYNFINDNGYFMESNKHSQEWLCMIDGGNNTFI